MQKLIALNYPFNVATTNSQQPRIFSATHKGPFIATQLNWTSIWVLSL